MSFMKYRTDKRAFYAMIKDINFLKLFIYEACV